MKHIVNVGNNNRDILASVPKRYRMIKIEKLGEEALKLVMNMIKKGHTYKKIAETLSETYETEIKPEDVSKVLKDNAILMVNYRAHLEKYNLNRANLVLDEAVKFTEAVDNLDTASTKILACLDKALTNDDVIGLSKALSDNVRTMSGTIKDFKRLTGQSKEKPSILIDQSTKQINVATGNDSATNRLVKELGMANFNIKKYKEPENKDGRFKQNKEKVVNAEVVGDDDDNNEDEMSEENIVEDEITNEEDDE